MADYYSPYTGEQIDLAVDDIRRSKNFICLWGSCCSGNPVTTNCPDITRLPTSDGSHEGIYLIVYSDKPGNPNDSGSIVYTSLITIRNTNQHAVGSSTTWLIPTTNTFEVTTCDFQNLQFIVRKHVYDITTNNPPQSYVLYVHEVYRYQKLLYSPEPTC